jgi:hypothetical protein
MKERSRYRVDGDCLGQTAESPIWDPNSTMFDDLEMRLVDRYGELEENPGTTAATLSAHNQDSTSRNIYGS